MERNRPPAQTPSWKVGFLVSLLLVAVSIGVGYAITRTYGLKWTWIAFPGPDWYSFTFDLEAFKREMLLLVAIVPAAAFFSFFLIAGAVRKQRAGNDPAAEYKQLIRSLNQIKDLNDDRKIRKIAGHRELRDFLVKIRNEIGEREKAIAKREAALDASPADAEAPPAELSTEAAILVSAIMNAKSGGLKAPLALTVPELVDVEAAVRDHLSAAEDSTAPAPVDASAVDAVRSENNALHADLDAARAALGGACEELASCARSAKEIEILIRDAGMALDAAGDEPSGNGDSMRILDALDAASEALVALGEETKGIAINAAMQAGSAADAQTGIVEIADNMREIATRFNQIAAAWTQTTTTARAALENNGNGSLENVGEVVREATSRVSRWVERATLLAERIAAGANPSVTKANESFSLGEEQGDDPAATDTGEYDIPLEKQSRRPVIEEGGAAGPGISGIVKDKTLFKPEAAEGDDDFFVDIPGQEHAAPAAESAEGIIEQEPATPSVDESAEPAPGPTLADEGFLQGPAPSAPRKGLPDELSTSPPPADETPEDVPVEAHDPDDDAIDLYALGAVDYVAEGAVHPE